MLAEEKNNLRYFNYMFKKVTFSNYLLFRHIDLSWINTARRKLLSAQLYYNFYDNCIETSSCPSKYIFLERTLVLHRFNSHRTDIRISKLNFRVRWHARRFIFEVLDEGNGTEVRGEGGRMHRVPGCTSCSANSLPSYLASAVVNWIYRSLLANVARKGGLPERTDKKIMWRGEKRQDRIGREDDGERRGKVWTKLISRPSIPRRFCPVASWKTRRRSGTPSSGINYEQDENEKKIERSRRRRMLKNDERAREGDCWESTPQKNRTRNSEAPMHIIDRPCRLIRRTLQSRHRKNSARRLFWRRHEPDVENLA